MGFKQGAYATVWSVEEGKNGKSTRARLSITRKQEDGTYNQEFGGFCDFYGTAHAKAEKLKVKDRIRLDSVEAFNRYDKEQNKEFVWWRVKGIAVQI